MTVKERLIDYIKFKGVSVNRFEKTCGLSTGYVGNMRVSIQPSKLTNIAHNYPDLNTGWLMTGEGEMLKTSTPKSEPIATDNETRLWNMLESQQQTIRELSKSLEKAQQTINELTKSNGL